MRRGKVHFFLQKNTSTFHFLPTGLGALGWVVLDEEKVTHVQLSISGSVTFITIINNTDVSTLLRRSLHVRSSPKFLRMLHMAVITNWFV